jgi:hypothetical protein
MPLQWKHVFQQNKWNETQIISHANKHWFSFDIKLWIRLKKFDVLSNLLF